MTRRTPQRRDGAEADPPGPLPLEVRKALAFMRASLAEPISLADLLRRTSVAERTLNEQFRAFVGTAPMRHLRRMRLAEARRLLLTGERELTVTEVAQRLQFHHAGRFAQHYKAAFGETPSATLARRRGGATAPYTYTPEPDDLSVAIVVAPSDGTTAVTSRRRLSDALSAAMCAMPGPPVKVLLPRAGQSVWSSGPSARARYLMRVRQFEDHARVRLGVQLEDRHSGALLWADGVDGPREAAIALEEMLAQKVRHGIGTALRRVEMAQAQRRAASDLDARGLAMRALPLVFSSTAEGSARALELIDRALEIDPDNALAMALAAWAHGQRVMYTVAGGAAEDRTRALALMRRAAIFGTDDPLEVTARAAVHMMLGDLTSAEALIERALLLDPGFGWAWGRSGWLHAYRGNWTTALRHFRLALRTGPQACRANVLAGIGGAHFGAGRYDAAARYAERALIAQPGMEWCNRSLSVCYARLGERGRARRAVDALRRYNPGLTVSGVVASIPFRPEFLDRLGSGLSDLGLPP